MSSDGFPYRNGWYDTNGRNEAFAATSGAVELHESSHDTAEVRPKSSRNFVLLMLAATLLLVAIGGYAHSSYAERQHQAALANARPITQEPEQPETAWPAQTLTPEIVPPPPSTPPPPPPSATKDPEPPAPETKSPPAKEEPVPAQAPSSSAPGCKPCPGGSGVYPAYPTRGFGSSWDYGGVWVNGPAWYPPVKVRSNEVGWLWVWDCNDFYLRPPH